MFIDQSDTVDVIIYYKKHGRSCDVITKEAFEKLTEEKDKYKELNVTMRVLTWGLYNDIQDASYVLNDLTGRIEFKNSLFKLNKLKKLIVKWNATRPGKNGEQTPIKVDENSILNLVPSIAESIINIYDDISLLSEEEEKK